MAVVGILGEGNLAALSKCCYHQWFLMSCSRQSQFLKVRDEIKCENMSFRGDAMYYLRKLHKATIVHNALH